MQNSSLKTKTIFDILNDLSFNKVSWENQGDTDQKKVQTYMLNRWLSMHPDYLELVAECQSTTDLLDSKQYYKFYLDLLPKKKFFTKYIKSEKERGGSSVIKFMAEKLQLGSDEAEQYYDLLLSIPDGLTELKEWIKLYGYDDKKIKSEFKI